MTRRITHASELISTNLQFKPGSKAERLMSATPPAPGRQQDAPPRLEGHAAALKFLDFIFDGVANAFSEFRYFSPGRRPKIEGSSTYLSLPLDHERFKSEVFDPHAGQTIMVGPAPRFRIPAKGSAGRDRDVLQVGCVWARLESLRTRGGAIEILKRIRDFPLRPSVAVNSGFGYQFYFTFHVPIRAGELLVWSDLTRELRAALGAGERVNLNEVMTLPGTMNVSEAHPVPCEIWEERSSWTRYSVEEVRAAVAESVERLPRAANAPSLKVLRERGVKADILEAIVTGHVVGQTEVGYGEMSDLEFLIAYELLDKNFSEDEVKAVFRAHPNGCGSSLARTKGAEKYLESIIRNASDRLGGSGSFLERSKSQEGDEDYPGDAMPHGYVLRGGSIWFEPPVTDTSKKAPSPVKVCNSFIRIAEIRESIDTGEISLSIAFDYLGRTRSVPILRSQMADSRKLVTALSGAGAPITSNNARLVLSYLSAYEHTFATAIPHKRVTSRFGRGRTGGPFFLPGLHSGVEFAPASPGDAALYRAYSSRRGSLGGWLEVMHALADQGLMIPQVAVIASFVPPLQSRLRIPNFILDIHGNTSTGKSTSLKLAASVYGKPHDPDSAVLQWMNTQAAVEQVAGLCSELPIYLDDAQHCPAELKRSIIYMIANGRGKGRGTGGGIRETATWHTVALSTSEEPLHESSPHEGARGRILPVGGMTPPFGPGMGSLVQTLEGSVASNHGYAGESYIRHLNGWGEGDWSKRVRRYSAIQAELQRSSSSALVGRVSGYIAAIQLAGEVASPLLGLRFKPDVVGAWLLLHLDELQSDQNMVLLALRELSDFYVANINRFGGDGHYRRDKRGSLYGASKKQQYVGFLRSTVDTIFKRKRWNPSALLNKLAAAGALHATEEDRYTKKVSVSGVQHRMICVKWSAIMDGEVNAAGRANLSGAPSD